MARPKKQPDLRPNANPDDIAACYAEYASLRGEQARIGQKIAATLGRYEKMGVDSKATKNAYAEAQKDPNEVAAQERKNAEYLRILGVIEVEKGGQGSFMPGLKVAKPSKTAMAGVAAARAHADGYNSGLAGGKIDACKFATGSEEFVAWRDGWDDGRSDRIARNPDAANKVKVEPKRGEKRKGPEQAEPNADPEPAAKAKPAKGAKGSKAKGRPKADDIGETVGTA